MERPVAASKNALIAVGGQAARGLWYVTREDARYGRRPPLAMLHSVLHDLHHEHAA
jgi:hypothetical protein